jgi:Sec-independent protein secretion pathway component TatC
MLPAQSDDLQMTAAEHYAELAWRVFRVSLWVLVAFVITVPLWKVAAQILFSITRRLGGGSPEWIKDVPFDRWLWAAFVAFLTGFYKLVQHAMSFTEPALYPDERKILRVVKRWLYISPLLAVLLPGVCLRLGHFIAWIVRATAVV